MMGTLTPDEIESVLRAETIGRIGCVADGWPYIVPITYVYDGAEFVFSHSAPGQKTDAMRLNKQVCFEVEQIQSMTNWRTVVATGHYEELARDDEERAMDLLAGKFASFEAGSPRTDRREDLHRREGIVRSLLFRIRLHERSGRYQVA